ncbi:unnamed protein product [Zymoseptoria tritici ST99CH_1E4]|uniref:Uncharacterized protein n=1 Tax=Zymoseptoria tritici ST99CH_1E4 TaxID=1276532 RepID=A0A2H1GB22_ZYMTR|nr:unnamed protein product [Zymoseptoria tritici ST99CH_1E4]
MADDKIVTPTELVGNLAAGAASAVFPPSSMCFGAVMYLIGAAGGDSASLDAIAELLDVLKDITVRLAVYNQEDLSRELQYKLAEILTTVSEVFARSTKVVKEGVLHRMKAFGKNLLLGLMTRLEKLTSSEDRLVGAEKLEMSLTQNQMAHGVGQILNALEDTKGKVKQEHDVKYMETINRVLKPSVSPQERFDEIRREHIEHSGDWICSEEAFTARVTGQAPILWISGMSGSGKSFLTYTMIDHIKTKFADEEGSAGRTSVGFTFFRDNKDQTRSFEQAPRDVAFQLAQTDESYAKHICECVYNESDVATIRSAWQRLFVDFFLESDQTDSSAFILFDGMDEASPEGRETFLELLKDVEIAGTSSRLRVGMLGHPQILDDIADILEQQVPSEKNGQDIAQSSEASMSKSRTLKQLSQNLKDEIKQTLTEKGNEMFMWARLMISELSETRPYGDAPARFTRNPAAIKDPQDAEDLNDMLMWVTLAKRPLSLDELDAMLRLKYLDGEGVLNLEGKFASSKKIHTGEEDEDAIAGANVDEEDGLDDVENDTEFSSNPATTSVGFVHPSISDFFKDRKQGKINAGVDAPAIGVHVEEAALSTTKTCLDLVVEDALLDRMDQAVSLRPYAEHLEDLDQTRIDETNKIEIGSTLVKILRDDEIISTWSRERDCLWFRPTTASRILPWVLESSVLAKIPDDTATWLKSSEISPIELFELAVRFSATRWLEPGGENWNIKAVSRDVAVYLQMKNGAVIEEEPDLSQEQIIAGAE